MTDQGEAEDPNPENPSGHSPWIARTINGISGYLRDRRSQKDNETATDRAARRTANATWAIAILTAATIAVGISQYRIFHRQLREMEKAYGPLQTSADAAKIAAEASQRTLESIERPIVSFTGESFPVLDWSNYGKTFGRVSRFCYRVLSKETDIPPEPDWSGYECHFVEIKLVPDAAGSKPLNLTDMFGSTDKSIFGDAAGKFIIVGYFNYFDVLSSEYFRDFAFSLNRKTGALERVAGNPYCGERVRKLGERLGSPYRIECGELDPQPIEEPRHP